jgi:hypothetical protein
LSARRPAANRSPAESRDEIQRFVTYHTRKLDAIENRATRQSLLRFYSKRTRSFSCRT